MTEFGERDVRAGAEKFVDEHARWSRRALIEAAMSGQSVREVLVIGTTVVPAGITLESIVAIRDEMLREGVIALNPDYSSTITEKGEAEFFNGPTYNRHPGTIE